MTDDHDHDEVFSGEHLDHAVVHWVDLGDDGVTVTNYRANVDPSVTVEILRRKPDRTPVEDAELAVALAYCAEVYGITEWPPIEEKNP